MLLRMLATKASESRRHPDFLRRWSSVRLYFFYLRPRSKSQKAARQQARKVEVGERAQTVGGFVGTVIHARPTSS